MQLNTRRMIGTLALLLSATSLGWLGWVAQAARADRHLSERASRAASSAAPATLAATITVNGTADGTLAALAANSTCDLREAIEAANTDAAVGQCPAGMAGLDTINFSVTGTITISGGELFLIREVTITGPGANLLTLSGNNASRVFFVLPGVRASLNGLTITGGNGGGAVNGAGGCIHNQGDLTITASHITGNTASFGGGIYNFSGTLTVERSAVTNNTANGSFTSGGIDNFGGTLIVTNSTVSGNRATGASGGHGGGIQNRFNGLPIITASTVTDNEAAGPNSASGVRAQSRTVTVRNTIIAANRNNTSTPDVNIGSGLFISQGYNLIGNPGNATIFTAPGDQVGTMAAPLNPVLGPLANNGGSTPTHRPLPGSPVIDKGNSFGLTVDQRGSPRPVDMPTIANASGGDGADIGAYELLGPAVPNTPLVIIVDLIACTGPGDVLTVTVAIINPAVVAQPVTLTSTLPVGLVGLPGTSTSTVGAAPVVTATGVAFGPSMLAAEQTLTVTYQVQVGDAVGGAQLCINTTSTSSDAASLSVQTCTMVDCPPVGPGLPFSSTSEVSDQKAGSVLVYNLYSSSASALNTQNTRISITNTNPALDTAVHLFFVDGATCSIADAIICLTKNQTATFLASDLDPGTTGYLVAVASDPTTGCPVNFNFLIGDAYVKLSSGHAANLGAEAFAALAGGPVACDGNAVTAQLNFDGISYNRAPRTLAASSIPARPDGNDTLLVVNRFGGNLATGAATLTNLFGIFYDDAENALSFTFNPGVCQFRSSLLANNFPRTTPRLDSFIAAGRSGWLRLYSTSDIGLLGAVLNYNPNAPTNAGAFNQGRNLHKLTLTSTQTLIIPIFPPNCLD